MEKVKESLFQLQDLGYRDFHGRLIPNVPMENIIGVRTPQLRKFAKEFAKDGECLEFLKELPHEYYEENNLHGFLIDNLRLSYEETLVKVEEFLPYIDNWATCDVLTLKVFEKNPESLYKDTKKWLESPNTYTVRFAIVTQLRYFLDENFQEEMLGILGSIHTEEYYINMAIAWYYSFALIKQYPKTIGLFTEKKLDKWIHNKSLQKAIESYRIDKEKKDYFRSLKIK